MRRSTKNTTGIRRIEGIPNHDAWIAFLCVKCHYLNHKNVGQVLLDPREAYESESWTCKKCNFVHSKNADLYHFKNWDAEYADAKNLNAQRFWKAFFKSSTENTAAYWKQCNSCGRILPFSHFSKHTKWGPLERQIECRSCKAAINAKLNPLRTREQLHESSVRRRVADSLVKKDNEKINHKDLFERFNSRCFKTKKLLNIKDKKTWAIDHTLPSKYLYPLNFENATLLSTEANSNKSDSWPSDFYTNSELIKLAKITGANLELLSATEPIINKNIDVNEGVKNYLSVRENSNLQKRIFEIKNLIEVYDLKEDLSLENKKLLGY